MCHVAEQGQSEGAGLKVVRFSLNVVARVPLDRSLRGSVALRFVLIATHQDRPRHHYPASRDKRRQLEKRELERGHIHSHTTCTLMSRKQSLTTCTLMSRKQSLTCTLMLFKDYQQVTGTKQRVPAPSTLF